MPDSFAIAPNNLLIDVNGIDIVMGWDGLQTSFFPIGVPAPATALTISADSAGLGSISGTYSAYVRFYDNRGNFSSLSPVSNEVVAANATTITYANVPISTDPAVIGRQILRNAAGEATVYYVDIDTTDLGSTNFTSTQLDASLQEQDAQSLFDTSGNSLADMFGLPPDWKPIIAQHQTRIWLAGETPYFEGAAVVTFMSETVQGIATGWKSNWAGRFFYGDGSFAAIEIASVNVLAQTLTLVSPWVGPSDPYLYYTIKPAPAEKNQLYFSLPGQPEAWDPTDALEVPEDGFNITGLMPMSSFLYILKELRIYRLTDQGDPTTDGFIFESARRGCVNNRCWATVGLDAYLLDYYGCYKFSGGQTDEISLPIQGIFRGNNRYYRLNWQQSRYWHAIADLSNTTIRWFVTLGGDYLPKHALCYNYGLKRWWVERYEHPIGCSAIAPKAAPYGGWRSYGQERLYVGSQGAQVFAFSPTVFLDGPDPTSGATRCQPASWGIDWLIVTGASFANGTLGSYLTIVRGRGEGQTRKIIDVAGDVLTVDQPWAITPDETTLFQIGAVYWEYRTGRMTFADGEARQTRKIQLGYRPVPVTQEAIAEMFRDYSETAITQQHNYNWKQRRGVSSIIGDPRQRIDLTRSYGVADINIDAQRERDTDARRRLSFSIYGWNRESQLTLKRLIETGTTGSE